MTVVMEAPPRDAPQHLHALAKANRVRLARAELKRRIAAGSVAPERTILEPPAYAEDMAIAELLRAQRQWGRSRARRFLHRMAVAENRPLGRLTVNQRTTLVYELAAANTKSEVCDRCGGKKAWHAAHCRACYDELRGVSR